MKKYLSNLSIYNELWIKGKVTVPLIIIIGGAAGTGKTTLANKLRKYIPYNNYVNSTLIRALTRLVTPQTSNPYLYSHTFDLYEFDNVKNINDIDAIKQNFLKQAIPITKLVEKFIESLITEKQHYIIEGSNILPVKRRYGREDVIICEFYLYVEDKEQQKEMLEGPTHNRKVSSNQLKCNTQISKIINDMGNDNNKKVIKYDTNIETFLKEIDEAIKDFLVRNKHIH